MTAAALVSPSDLDAMLTQLSDVAGPTAERLIRMYIWAVSIDHQHGTNLTPHIAGVIETLHARYNYSPPF